MIKTILNPLACSKAKCISTLLSFMHPSVKPKINPQGNYYHKLMLKDTASLVEIKKNYYELIKKYHPDLNKDQESTFKQIREAYEILSDFQLRKQYDEMIAEKPTSNTKTENAHEEGDTASSGPYQTQEEYQQFASKGSYSLSAAEWNKTRLGFKHQSYVSLQSNLFRAQGAQSDEQVVHYKQKNAFLRSEERLDNQKNVADEAEQERIRQRSAELKRRHRERVQKVKRGQEKEEPTGKFKSITNKLKSWLG